MKRFTSIRFKIFVSIFSITLLSQIVLINFCNAYFTTTLTKYEFKYSLASSAETIKSIEFLLDSVDATSQLICNNSDVLDAMETDPEKPVGHAVAQSTINAMLKGATKTQNYIKDIFLIGNNGDIYTSADSISKEDIAQKFHAFSASGDIQYSKLYSISNKNGSIEVISYAKPIVSPKSGKLLGTFLIDLNYNYLMDLLTISSAKYQEKVMVINDTGDIIFSFPKHIGMEPILRSNPEIISTDDVSLDRIVYGLPSIVVSNSIRKSNWKLVRIISKEDVYKDTDRLKNYMYVFSIIFMAIGFLLSFFLAKAITRPLTELNSKIKQVEQGDLSIQKKPIQKDDELHQLSNAFDQMLLRLQEQIKLELDSQKLKSDMAFQILQNQINPHFLYNTLDSVKWLATLNNMDNISEMVTALIHILRYNLSGSSVIATLQDELLSIDNYIVIQKYRYGDSFEITYDIAPETKQCLLLRFTLQPIVENAIFHGFSNLNGWGKILIQSYLQDKNLMIEISDNGVGFDAETLYSVDSISRKDKFSGIGLSNIRERIRLYFGEEYDMLLTNSSALSGAKVTLRLPCLIDSAAFEETSYFKRNANE